MVINKEIREILRLHNIDADAGLLILLGIYFKLNVDAVCPEEAIKAINITKIVEKDYSTGVIMWNVPLFEGQQTEWEWVKDYNDAFGRINAERKDSLGDVTRRMIEFFKKYPHYRVSDIRRATQAYFASLTSPTYLKSSAKFIFEGIGATKMSHLAKWCEKTASSEQVTQMKGKIIN